MHRFGLRPAGAAALAAVLVVLALGGAGYARNEPPTGPRAELTKFYGASRWLATNSETRWGGQLIGSLDCLESAHMEGGDHFRIPLDLPDGARITKVTYYYFDTDPEAELHFWLGTHVPGVEDSVDEEQFPRAVSEDQPLWPEDRNPGEVVSSVDVTPTPPVVIDNAGTSYHLAVGFSECGTFTPQDETEQTFILADGVRVHYTLR